MSRIDTISEFKNILATVLSVDSATVQKTYALSQPDLTGDDCFASVRTQGRNKLIVQVFAQNLGYFYRELIVHIKEKVMNECSWVTQELISEA